MSTQPHDTRLFDPSAVKPIDVNANIPPDERPQLGEALKAAVEAMILDGTAVIEGGRIMWPKDAHERLEHVMCPRLANALAQPLQHQWILEYFLAVFLTYADLADSMKAVHQLLGVYIGMACGQIPWPAPPTEEEAAEAQRLQNEMEAAQ
jgi:hypothetical protein